MYVKNQVQRVRSTAAALTLPLTALLISGCYTQFSTLDRYEQTSPPPQEEVIIDSTGDTVKVVREKDTVFITRQEVRYWERDMFGHPHLRSYRSYYDDDWYRYSSRPWWYDTYSYSDYYYPYNSYSYPFSYDYWYYRDYRHNRYHHYNYDESGSSGTHSSGSSHSPSVITDLNNRRGGTGSPANSSSGTAPTVGPRPLTNHHIKANGSVQTSGSAAPNVPAENQPAAHPAENPPQGSGDQPATNPQPQSQPSKKSTNSTTQRRFGGRR